MPSLWLFSVDADASYADLTFVSLLLFIFSDLEWLLYKAAQVVLRGSETFLILIRHCHSYQLTLEFEFTCLISPYTTTNLCQQSFILCLNKHHFSCRFAFCFDFKCDTLNAEMTKIQCLLGVVAVRHYSSFSRKAFVPLNHAFISCSPVRTF